MDLHGLALLGKEEHGIARGFGSFVVSTSNLGTRAADPDSLEHSVAAAVTGLSVENPPNLLGLNPEKTVWAQRRWDTMSACLQEQFGPQGIFPCYFCLGTWSHWSQSRDGKEASAGVGVG